MNDVKSIFSSVTFWSATLSLLGAVAPKALPILGITPTNQDTVVSLLVAVVGWGGAVYGRMRASKAVTLTGKPKA